MRIADNAPHHCSVCYGAHPEKKHIDFQVDLDAPLVLDGDGKIATTRDGTFISSDDLMICQSCIEQACELLDLKPTLHAKQAQTIRRLELENEALRSGAVRELRKINDQVISKLEPARPRRRVAA